MLWLVEVRSQQELYILPHENDLYSKMCLVV